MVPSITSPGASSTSSRDASPSRDISPIRGSLKPPIFMRRGQRGYGFTLRAIRVFHGNSDYYTLHHHVVVKKNTTDSLNNLYCDVSITFCSNYFSSVLCSCFQGVEPNSPAYEAGLRTGDVITHINGESVQGLLHINVVSLILSGGNKATIRAIPIEQTSIKLGGRKRGVQIGKMAKRNTRKNKHGRTKSDNDKRRMSSLFKRLSSRRAEQHLGKLLYMNACDETFKRYCIHTSYHIVLFYYRLSHDSITQSVISQSVSVLRGQFTGFSHQEESERLFHPRNYIPSSDTSSQSSSPGSSTPNSPASSAHFNRPSSLHGLKHKLQTIKSPHRRKSVHNIPLSPLARTPSPSAMAVSPTRSPSPLTVVKSTSHTQQGSSHHPGVPPGISNMTQSYNPSNPNSSPSPRENITPSTRKSVGHPNSCEPGSPLLRRALSPDRLHPSSAEKLRAVTNPVQRKGSWHSSNPRRESMERVKNNSVQRKGSWHEKRNLSDDL